MGKQWKQRQTIFGGSKITADDHCGHEIKRHLLLGSKAMTNLDSILKSRDIILPTKVHLVKAMVFPVIMYGYDSWTMKMAEHQSIDASDKTWFTGEGNDKLLQYSCLENPMNSMKKHKDRTLKASDCIWSIV